MFHEPLFPKSEFRHRFVRAWSKMADAGLEALIAYSPGNQFWLTGFLWWEKRGSNGSRTFPPNSK